jgi:hypothetical protein
MLLDKSEIETVKEILDKFKESYQIADNILRGGNPSQDNILFYTHQRAWSENIVNKLNTIYQSLEQETIEERVLRALNPERNIFTLGRVMRAVEAKLEKVIEEKRRLAQEKERLQEEAKVRKKGFKESIDVEMAALGMKRITE